MYCAFVLSQCFLHLTSNTFFVATTGRGRGGGGAPPSPNIIVDRRPRPLPLLPPPQIQDHPRQRTNPKNAPVANPTVPGLSLSMLLVHLLRNPVGLMCALTSCRIPSAVRRAQSRARASACRSFVERRAPLRMPAYSNPSNLTLFFCSIR